MTRLRNYINKLTKFQKISYLIILLGFVLLLSIGIPTLARLKNRNTLIGINSWDGSIATSYKTGTGTESNPYIISNGGELAYFYTELINTNYDNTYFELSNDIILNKGLFNYDEINGIQYILNNETYYIDKYTNKYYENSDMSGALKGTVNIFNPLNNFKGNFNGKSYTIYGLYITDETSDKLGLFTNLQGNVQNLYIQNSIIYGGKITGGIASNTNNSIISDVLFDGFVVGRDEEINNNIEIPITSSVIYLQYNEMTSYLDLSNNIPFVGSEIISSSISGNYTINNATESNTTIKINNNIISNGSFAIDLGTNLLNSISVLTSTTSLEENPTLTFSNLKYTINYKYGVAGGIVGISNTSSIKNTINKSSIYGHSVSGGLIGVTTELLNINQSYNVGDIKSSYSSGGLIGAIEKSNDNINVLKSYNTGDIFATNIGGLLGIINDNVGIITINNVFNSSTTDYSIGTINSTTVNISNAYFTNGVNAVNNGETNGAFNYVSIDNLKTKSYVVNNLSFDEFVNFEDLELNAQNVWIYENDELPILYIDDIVNPIANIHASVYTWNNFSYELNPINLYSNITFSIEAKDELNPLKEVYYYISNSGTPLTKEEMEEITSWNSYSNIVQITEDGSYVIYAKVIDYDDNVTYLNTDVLILDLSTSLTKITYDNYNWSNLRYNLDYIYINKPIELNVLVDESVSLSSIKYYISNELLNVSDLEAIASYNWHTYYNNITLDDFGDNIVYVKITDTNNNVTYLNTDYIVYNGYTESNLIIGKNVTSYIDETNNITNRSTITLNITYNNTSTNYVSGYTHNLISNILFPVNTKITLIDNINNKIYQYIVPNDNDLYNYNSSCDIEDLDCLKIATYPFNLFKEVGKVEDNNFVENFYYNNGEVNENFTIILDFSKTNFTSNYSEVKIYTELHDTNGINIRPTLDSTIKNFNIFSTIDSENAKANLNITTNYSGENIIFNKDLTTNIRITSNLDYKYIDGSKIIDTYYENKQIGILIKLVDSENHVVNREFLKNIIFKVDDQIYYPEEDGIIHINFNNGITDITKNLTIITYENNSNLEDGEYYFKIYNYIADDGIYYEELNNNNITIPVTVVSNANIEYNFDVLMDIQNCIINKQEEIVNVKFNILQNGLRNPNIRISLYKKDELTAYNQNYSLIDLENFVSDELNRFASSVYYVSTDPLTYNGTENTYNDFELNLITANFENNGYKFVFELYDGTKKIGSIDKYFVVK